MARPLRIEYPGAVYHVTSRGNGGTRTFRSDKDRQHFLDLLASVIDRFRWVCHAYCLMDNHYHLLIETPDGNLSRGMRHLNGVYTQWWNWKYQKTGHLFQGRYKSIIVDKDAYLLELTRYVALNPVRSHTSYTPGDWTWSSFRATVGDVVAPGWLTVDGVLTHFSNETARARELYREFVLSGITQESPWSKLKAQVFLGEKEFVDKTKGRRDQIPTEVPRSQRYADRPSLSDLFTSDALTDRAVRNAVIRTAYNEYRYTLKEIADHLEMHYATLSRIVKVGERTS